MIQTAPDFTNKISRCPLIPPPRRLALPDIILRRVVISMKITNKLKTEWSREENKSRERTVQTIYEFSYVLAFQYESNKVINKYFDNFLAPSFVGTNIQAPGSFHLWRVGKFFTWKQSSIPSIFYRSYQKDLYQKRWWKEGGKCGREDVYLTVDNHRIWHANIC